MEARKLYLIIMLCLSSVYATMALEKTTLNTRKSETGVKQDSTSVVNADTTETSVFSAEGEFKGGATFSYYIPKISGSEVDAWGLGIDYTGGKYLMDKVFLEGGLGFVLYRFKTGSGKYKMTESQDVLRVPLSVGYTLSTRDQRMHLNLFTGPRVSYIIAGSQEYDGETIKYKDLEEKPDRFFVDWSVGAYFSFKTKEGANEGFGVGVEYGLDTGDKRFDYWGIFIRFGFN